MILFLFDNARIYKIKRVMYQIYLTGKKDNIPITPKNDYLQNN